MLPMVRAYWIDSRGRYVGWALREIAHGRDVRWALGILWRSGPRVLLTEYAVEIALGPLLLYVQRKPMSKTGGR